jgi:hypothetical protein
MKSSCNLLIIILLLSIHSSCNKDNKVNPKVPLTDCAANSSCTYNFTEQADIQEPGRVIAGANRVFYYNSINTKLCSANTQLYFKTSLSGNDFTISGSQIAAGNALYNFICPCCDYISLKAIDGEIKGTKVNANKWLVNATIVLGNPQSKTIDTIKINQYFVVKALVN